MLLPTNESKELKKYKELWSKVRDMTRSMTKNAGDYDEKYVNIKFHLDMSFK